MEARNATVDESRGFHYTSHQISPNWYKKITHKNGRPYYQAIALLAEIVEWYLPEPIYGPKGHVIETCARFKGPYLSRSYADYSKSLNLSEPEVRRGIKYLENIGAIQRHFQATDDDVCGHDTGPKLMIELFPEFIIGITPQR